MTAHPPQGVHSAGAVALDALVVAGLRAGVLVACQHGDGWLAFTRTTGPATP